MAQHHRFTRKEWVFLSLLAATQFNHIVDFVIMMPLGETIMRAFAISPQQFSLLVATYTLSAAASAILSSMLADQFDRKKFLMIFYTGFILGTFACALSNTFETLLIARGIAGFFGGVIGSIVMAMVSDYFPFERRGTAMGVLMGSFALASVIGVPLGLLLATRFEWHVPFFAVGILASLVMILIHFRIPSMGAHLNASPGESNHPMATLRRIFSSRDQLVALGFMFVLNLGQFSIIPFIAPSLVSNAGLPEKDLFYMYLIGGSVSFVTSFIVGRLSDVYGKRPVFLVAMLASLAPVYLLTHLGRQPTWIIIGVAASFFMIMAGRNVPASAMCSAATDHRHRGSFMSAMSAVQNLAAGLAAMIAGAVVVRAADGHLNHFDTVGYFSMALAVVAMFASFLMRLPEGETK